MEPENPAVPVARIFYRGRDSVEHGWFVQHYVHDELRTIRLELRENAGRQDVITEAAGFVGCIPEQVQVEGAPWPALQLPM